MKIKILLGLLIVVAFTSSSPFEKENRGGQYIPKSIFYYLTYEEVQEAAKLWLKSKGLNEGINVSFSTHCDRGGGYSRYYKPPAGTICVDVETHRLEVP